MGCPWWLWWNGLNNKTVFQSLAFMLIKSLRPRVGLCKTSGLTLLCAALNTVADGLMDRNISRALWMTEEREWISKNQSRH